LLRAARRNDAPNGAAPRKHNDKILILDPAKSLNSNFAVIATIIPALDNVLFPEPGREGKIKAPCLKALLAFGIVLLKTRSTAHCRADTLQA
jgi:hypothetical protein